MVDHSGTYAAPGLSAIRYDDASGVIVMYTDEIGLQFQTWNPYSGGTSGSWASLGYAWSLDITADGKYALLGSDKNQLERVNVSTLAVENINYADSTTPNDIVATKSGVVLGVTYNGVIAYSVGPTLVTTIGTVWTPPSESYTEPGFAKNLISSENHRYVLIRAEQNTTPITNALDGSETVPVATRPGTLAVYDSLSGQIVANNLSAFTDHYNNFRVSQAGGDDISEAAGQAVIANGGQLQIFDLGLNPIQTLASSNRNFLDAHYSAGGHQLFAFDAEDNDVLVYDTLSWAQVGVIHLGPPSDSQAITKSFNNGGQMATSNDGRMLFLQEYGVDAIDLSARLSLTVVGDATHTQLYGSVGSDTITGSAADDTIDGGGGDDVLDGAGGINTVSFGSAAAGVTVSLALQGGAQNTIGAGTDLLSNFQNLTGSAFSDHLTGDSTNNVIDAGAGGNDVMDGGGGVNTVSFAHAATGVKVSLALQGQAQIIGAWTDTLSNFQNIIGSAHSDTLQGDAGDNTFLISSAGNVIDGGGGTNTLEALGVADQSGDSLANIQKLTFGQNPNLPTQSAFGVTLSAAEVVSELPANLAVIGTSTPDTVTVKGAAGTAVDLSGWTFSNWTPADTVAFTAAAAENLTISTLNPGAYSITLGGGSDALTLASTGGQFQAANLITVNGFQVGAGGDRLDMAAYLNSVLHGYAAGSDPFALGYLRLFQSGDDTLVQIDQDGGGDNFQTLITLKGVDPYLLTVANFDGLAPVGSPVPNIVKAPPGGGVLMGAAGDTILVGAVGGLNTVVFSAPLRSYGVSVTANGAAVSGGREGAQDTLTNIQKISFVDGVLSTGTTDAAAQVYRVYEATLGRAPDPVGLANWVHALEGGKSLESVIDGFVNSTEFQNIYGLSLSNQDFVTLLYNNVLHRAPDAGGLANWVSSLTSGQTRSQVVEGFSESPEDIATLAAPVQAGLWVQDVGAAEVARLYDTTLARRPDASGLTNWTELLDKGTETLQQVAQGFVGSPEFQSVYGALDNTHFVEQLYLNTLHRPADDAGLSNWVNNLAKGMSRAQVVIGFSESQEHIANLAHYIDQGVWLA